MKVIAWRDQFPFTPSITSPPYISATILISNHPTCYNELVDWIECFGKDVPVLSPSPNARYRTVEASGKTTKDAKAPGTLEVTPVDPLIAQADAILNELQRTELGTSNTIFLYVIAPIIEFLNHKYGDTLEYTTELSRSIEKEDQVNAKAHNGVRFDAVFLKRQGGGVIALLDFKRKEYLVSRDFEGALVEEKGSSPDGLLTRNGAIFTKQISAYAVKSGCKHVALFNWDHLLLFDFFQVEKKSNMERFIGKKARLTWVVEREELQGKHMKQHFIRKALLGWLLRAFEDTDMTPAS
ncbi:hypothetical protein J4E83_009682 [Alternaria metachromatica]|uniref:uncharacterized protein n=1 Tax=Alternaria metachromatica TaxID=283354 RepID=UPI0020C40D00|nr:uncharacterized protein J4E83_009682 [Alternaria metachromatica]KAI4607226.1 hypothetical protein J4E83_009682 [Alternaria metachromatica]